MKQSDGFRVAFGYSPNIANDAIIFNLDAYTVAYGAGEHYDFNIYECTQEDLDAFYPIRESQTEDLE